MHTHVIIHCVWISVSLYLHTYAAWTKEGNATNIEIYQCAGDKTEGRQNVLTS